jgi:excisionase family DNA binding protein
MQVDEHIVDAGSLEEGVMTRTTRLALRPDEAARAVGVSRSFFFEIILPELRVIRRGRVRLIPVSELQRWLDANASRALGS